VAGALQALIDRVVYALGTAIQDQAFTAFHGNKHSASLVLAAARAVFVRQKDLDTTNRPGKPPKSKMHATMDIFCRGLLETQLSGNDLNTHRNSPSLWCCWFIGHNRVACLMTTESYGGRGL
jgi:hypothetical protein